MVVYLLHQPFLCGPWFYSFAFSERRSIGDLLQSPISSLQLDMQARRSHITTEWSGCGGFFLLSLPSLVQRGRCMTCNGSDMIGHDPVMIHVNCHWGSLFTL